MSSLFNIFYLFVFYSHLAGAAACCGGGVSMPTLILNDDQTQVSLSYSATEVVIDSVDSQGYWRRWDEHQKVQTMKLDLVNNISDRWQAGLSVPVISREYDGLHSSGLGDIVTSLGYEYLPDWDYNPYRPRGLGFIQVQWPSGKSKAESEQGGLDSRGNGFWALGAGTLLTKTLGGWDAYSLLELHHSFEKRASSSAVTGTLRPGNGGIFNVGAGYNWSTIRAGLDLSDHFEDPVLIDSADKFNTADLERYTTMSASVSYLYQKQWSWTVSYTDQTLFGNPANTSLGRGVVLLAQRRWPR